METIALRLDPAHTPIEALSRFSDLADLCLLQSAASQHPLSRFSFFAADPVAIVHGAAEEWPHARDQVRATLSRDSGHDSAGPPFQGGWMGWLGYELGIAFDDVERHPVHPAALPDFSLALYDWVIAWDHRSGDVWLFSTGIDSHGTPDRDRAERRADEILRRWKKSHDARVAPQHSSAPAIEVHSDFTADLYQSAVQRVIDYVLAGDIFQANLAQRFTAPFHGDPSALHAELTRRSPAPMAAFIRQAGVTIASASPEQFIRFDAATRAVETRPIKGTRPRGADRVRDAELAAELRSSEKDRAENVMIVDLLRNDLSRVCTPGTVYAPVLCELESHPTVHHLVSTVTGELAPGHDALDLIAATFPGGSITGAPKLRAMEVIRELEPVARGVYSGAIGWIGLDGSMDTSIAIRTVTIADNVASFHAGGGITALSVPAEEYRETLDKADAVGAAVIASA